MKPDELYGSFGYALAMRVMQSDLYAQLDDRERGECDALAHGHASGQQGVEGFEPVNTAPRDGSPFLGTWMSASGRKFGWIEYDLFRERFVHFKTGNSWCQIDGWHPLAASPQITTPADKPIRACNKCGYSGPDEVHDGCNYSAAAMPAAQRGGYVKYEDARRAVALTIRSMTSAAPDKWPTADELMEAWDKVLVAKPTSRPESPSA